MNPNMHLYSFICGVALSQRDTEIDSCWFQSAAVRICSCLKGPEGLNGWACPARFQEHWLARLLWSSCTHGTLGNMNTAITSC